MNCKVSYGLWVIITSVQVKNVPYVNDVDNEEAIVSGSGGIWETSVPSSLFSYKKNKFLRTKHTENPKHLCSKSSPITGEYSPNNYTYKTLRWGQEQEDAGLGVRPGSQALPQDCTGVAASQEGAED